MRPLCDKGVSKVSKGERNSSLLGIIIVIGVILGAIVFGCEPPK